MTLTIRHVQMEDGLVRDIAIAGGRIAAIGPSLASAGEEIDGRGASALPGLHDHHVHVLALAARRSSLDLGGLEREDQIRQVLANAAPRSDGWVRAVNYHEQAAGLPDAALLDGWIKDRPLRVQDRTGALWVLNSRGLRQLEGRALPSGAERDAAGKPTGRFWREDSWLRSALPTTTPDLGELGQTFARLGLVALTDASATNGPEAAATLGAAHRRGELPQRLTLMGSEALDAGKGYRLGALKLLIDERDPPPLDTLIARIGGARARGRTVAAHCVTDLELALFLAALSAAGGACHGDRIEHGGLITREALAEIARAGLMVCTNPAFLYDRGEHYLRHVAEDRLDDLYRARSLRSAGIPLLAGSDAPYASFDPWLAMRSARDRRTAAGRVVASAERLSGQQAWQLYAEPSLAVGGPADLILCEGSPDAVFAELDADRVRMTIIAGKLVSCRDVGVGRR